MMLRRLLIAGVFLDLAAAAAAAKFVTASPDACPVAADVEVYAADDSVVPPDAAPRLKVEKSLVVLHDVRLKSSPGELLFARVPLDPETGGFLGFEPPSRECDLLD